jgi:hypothetical protein
MLDPFSNKGANINQNSPLHSYNTRQKYDEACVISSSNTGTQPLTVMIKAVYTIPTKVTVKGAFRSEYLACVTEFDPGHMAARMTHNKWMYTSASLFAPGFQNILHSSSAKCLKTID